jgi:hypothetical protein
MFQPDGPGDDPGYKECNYSANNSSVKCFITSSVLLDFSISGAGHVKFTLGATQCSFLSLSQVSYEEGTTLAPFAASFSLSFPSDILPLLTSTFTLVSKPSEIFFNSF